MNAVLEHRFGSVPGYCWFRFVPHVATTLRDGARGLESWYESWDALSAGIQTYLDDYHVRVRNASLIVRTGVVPTIKSGVITPVVLVLTLHYSDKASWDASCWLEPRVYRYESLSSLPIHIPVPSGPGILPHTSVQRAMWERFIPGDMAETSSLVHMRNDAHTTYFPPLRYNVPDEHLLDPPYVLPASAWEDLL